MDFSYVYTSQVFYNTKEIIKENTKEYLVEPRTPFCFPNLSFPLYEPETWK